MKEEREKQNEFEEKKHQSWLQFIQEELDCDTAKICSVFLTPQSGYLILSLLASYTVLFSFIFIFFLSSIFHLSSKELPLILAIIAFYIIASIMGCIGEIMLQRSRKNKADKEVQLKEERLASEKKRITQEYGDNPFDKDDMTRYDYCYCRSGQSFKDCHGQLDFDT